MNQQQHQQQNSMAQLKIHFTNEIPVGFVHASQDQKLTIQREKLYAVVQNRITIHK